MALQVVNDRFVNNERKINHKERFPLSWKDYRRGEEAASVGHIWERLADKPNDTKQYFRCERCQSEGFRNEGDRTMIIEDSLELETCDELVAKAILVS